MSLNLNIDPTINCTAKSAFRRPIDIHVGKRLKIRRKELGFCCKSLAQKMLMDEAVIKSFEGGYTRIGSYDLSNISEVLDVKISFFYAE